MYELAVDGDFIAQHFLICRDMGPESQKHSHHYRLEIQIKGNNLDNNGCLVDIVRVRDRLEKLLCCYQDRLLNDLPEFKGINPTIENLARIAYQSLYQSIGDTGKSTMTIKVWEDNIGWVKYREDNF